VENGGLEAHPSPKNYAYMGILRQKIQFLENIGIRHSELVLSAPLMSQLDLNFDGLILFEGLEKD